MATQTDVQQLIQGLTPSGVNNGNPNTAYNSPMPPVMDAFGNWSAPQVSRAANVTLNRGLPQGLPQPTAPTRVGFLPPLPPLNLNPNWVAPRPSTPLPPVQVTPPVAPPMSDPLPPQVAPPSTPVPPPQTNFGGGGSGLSNFDMGSIINQFTTSPTSGSTPGTGAPVDWRQVLDVITEPFLPGNMFLSGTGKWDLSNLLEGIAGSYGIPLGTLANLYGGDASDPSSKLYQLTQADPNTLSSPDKLVLDRYLDNAQNDIANFGKKLSGQISDQNTQRGKALTNELSQEIANKYGIDLTAPALTVPQGLPTYGAANNAQWVSRNTAATTGGGGATSIGGYFVNPETGSIEFDDAGQQAFESMRLAALMKGERQTGADILGRAYSK